MNISFDQTVRVAPEVLVSELDGESVILNLRSETYFGLDRVGTRMWLVATAAASIGEAFEALREEFDVEPDTLKGDLVALLENLCAQGLLEVRG